jgi:hypothetical protein
MVGGARDLIAAVRTRFVHRRQGDYPVYEAKVRMKGYGIEAVVRAS